MEKEKTVLEVCTDSIESAIAAKKGGADRIELCSNLIIGGTTPDTKMYRIIQNEAGIPARILIRPRFGDFCYSKYEKELILEQIQAFREEGAQGVVIGALLPDGSFDLEFMEECMKAAGNCKVTCHRAFDMCRDPFEALEALINLGVDTLLTSGQESSALAGANCLEALAAKAEGRIHILAGAGVSDAVIKPLYEKGIRHFHLSAKIELESAMKYRNTRVSMGLPGMSEYMIWQTDDKKVRSARMVLDACSGKEV
ncbi:MAG: copper homeostasis protein CutC [Firmicutes bacterium]|nr:copper homeostasis protein CutC [Bacillota bacterium]MDD6964471.1 copper homeostasis protein CutC [Bacillota bacterium]